MIELIDTHCHVQGSQLESDSDDPMQQLWLRAGKPDPDTLIQAAADAGVVQIICVGTDVADSQQAIKFVQNRDKCVASVGIHPHEAKRYIHDATTLEQSKQLIAHPKVVAIGETGLDYFYTHSPKEDQITIFRFQVEQALEHNLPLILHIRGAKDNEHQVFSDVLEVLKDYQPVRGVVHSFSANTDILQRVLGAGLHVGLNGIMTFSKNQEQMDAAKQVPLERLVLETDAPFLTPEPFRGRICEPKHIRVTAEFLSKLRGENLETLATATTHNAKQLFNLS